MPVRPRVSLLPGSTARVRAHACILRACVHARWWMLRTHAQHALLVGASIAGSIGGTAGGAHLNLKDDIVGLGALGGRSSHRLHRSERLGHMHAGHGRVQTCALTSSVCVRARVRAHTLCRPMPRPPKRTGDAGIDAPLPCPPPPPPLPWPLDAPDAAAVPRTDPSKSALIARRRGAQLQARRRCPRAQLARTPAAACGAARGQPEPGPRLASPRPAPSRQLTRSLARSLARHRRTHGCTHGRRVSN